MEEIFQDLKGAARSLWRDARFTLLAMLTLALGIGATCAVFNVVRSAMLRPLPYADHDQLVVLFATSPKRGIFRDTTSFLNFSEWKSQSYTLTDAAAYRSDSFNITGDGVPEPLAGLAASHEFFRVLGIFPVMGRVFDKEEQEASQPVAIIGHRLWTQRYGSDPDILSRTILLNEVSHAVVGVMAPGFEFPPFQSVDVVVPVVQRPCRSCGYVRGVARLKAGVPLPLAQQELSAIAARLENAFPESNEGRGVNAVPLKDVAVGPVGTQLLMLLGAGVFVLLIGCGNVANLVLAKGITRRREFAVRTVLGAGARRLIRLILIESVSLALAAALLGVGLAHLGSKVLVASLSQRFPLPAITFDWALLGFAVFIAVLAGVLSGLPLALLLWKSNLNQALGGDGRGQSGGVIQRRLGSLLVVSQTAFTVILLIAAGLLLRSFLLLHQIDTGINARKVLTATLPLSKRYDDPEQREVYLRQILNSVGELPGVQEVAVHTDPPFLGGGARETFKVEGHGDPSPGGGHAAGFNVVSTDFFRVMGIPITRGRGFDEQDAPQNSSVAVVNESMARSFWSREGAIGKRIRLYYEKDPHRWLTIIGVSRDARYRGRLVEPIPQVFVPYQQNPYRFLPYPQTRFVSLVVRTAAEPAALAAVLREGIWSVDVNQSILKLQPLEQALSEEVAEPRLHTSLLGIYALIAIAIASAGIYALSANAVLRRRREIGIRLAVGATTGQIMGLLLRCVMGLILLGTGIGVLASLALARLAARFLYGVTPTDAPTFLAVLLLFAAVAFVSTYVPTRESVRIDPAETLRQE